MVRDWSFHFLEGDRSWDESLLLCPIEQVLVEPFLLLSDESFLEGHLDLVGPAVSEQLQPVLLVQVEPRLVVVILHLVHSLDLFLVNSLIDAVQVVFDKMAISLPFDVIVLVAD